MSAAMRSTRKRPDRFTAKDGEKVLRRRRSAPAVLSRDAVFALDAKIMEDKDGATRRTALLVLSERGAKLLDDVAGDRDYAVAIADASRCLTHYVARLRQLIDAMENAQLRMVAALANRTDMDSVIREAKVPTSAEVRP